MPNPPRATATELLGRSRYVLLTTFRRDGTAVPTPVWVVPMDGILWVWSAPDAGKVKRVRRSGRVQLAPCTLRGAPLGVPVTASATVVPAAEARRVLPALVTKYGWTARLTLFPITVGRWMGRPRGVGALAITLPVDGPTDQVVPQRSE